MVGLGGVPGGGGLGSRSLQVDLVIALQGVLKECLEV